MKSGKKDGNKFHIFDFPLRKALKGLRIIQQYQVFAQPFQGWVLNKYAYPG